MMTLLLSIGYASHFDDGSAVEYGIGVRMRILWVLLKQFRKKEGKIHSGIAEELSKGTAAVSLICNSRRLNYLPTLRLCCAIIRRQSLTICKSFAGPYTCLLNVEENISI